MSKHTFFASVLLAAALFGAGCSASNQPSTATSAQQPTQAGETIPLAKPSEVLIFVSTTCPHCAKVESAVRNGRWDARLPIEFKVVNDKDDNLKLLAEKMRACGLPLDNITVPLLWNGRDCLNGDAKILSYLESILPNYASTSSTGN